MTNFAAQTSVKKLHELPSYKYMTSVIKYKCKCGKTHDIVPAYLKYVVEFLNVKKGAQLGCPNNKAIVIPARKIYSNYLKQYEQEKKQTTQKNS
jgi:hypothetical protein